MTEPSSSSIPPSLWLDLAPRVPDAAVSPMGETLEDRELVVEGLAEARAEEEELDLVDRHARDRLRAWVVGGEASPPRIGRFTLLQRLGSGGMGTVYAAYDDELDRRVALKFLHARKADDPAAQHRLLREAQALARLSHPHLVPVFEVGRFEGQVYLAMELVEGQTMRRWVERERPGWRQVLRAWIEVGAALRLVHAEGLVHRDVKPDNVIMGDDGRARLVDFGLAREVGEPSSGLQLESGSASRSGASASASASWASGSRLRESVTQSRTVIGTPAYLSPEQRMGAPCGPAADQYSFCISLYEGLYGCRPPGPVQDDALVRVPRGRDVPAALRRILTRGLAMEPGQRFVSIEALVRELERLLRRARRRWSGVAGLALTFGFVGAVIVARQSAVIEGPQPCEGVREGLSDAWNDVARTRLRQGGQAGLVPALDAFAEDWGSARHEACEATHVSGLQSVEVLDRRVACLDRLHDRVSALVLVPAGSSALASGIAELFAPSDCLLPGVAEGGWPPAPQWMQPEIEEIEARLARAPLLALDGKIDEARVEAQRALARAEALEHEPSIAAALLALGTVERMDFKAQPARDALERAVDLAEGSGELLLKEEVLGRLVRLAVDVDADRDEAQRAWQRYAATQRRVGPSRQRTAKLLASFGLVRHLHGDRFGAEVSLRAADRLYAEEGARVGPARAVVLRNLAHVLSSQQRGEEAEAAFERARSLEAAGGDASAEPWQRTARDDAALGEGNALLAEGRLDEARERLESAMHQFREAHGDRSVSVGYAHVSLVQVAVNEGRLDDARRHAEAADLALRTSLGFQHPDRLLTLSALGTVAFEQGRMQEAAVDFRDAVELAEHHESADSLILALHRSNLAQVLVRTGELATARALAEGSLVVREARLPPDHVKLAFPLSTLGEAWVREGHASLGIEPLTRALALHDARPAYPVDRARTRAWLARAHYGAGEVEAARPLAEAARTEYLALGDAYAPEVALLRGLLEEMPPPNRP